MIEIENVTKTFILRKGLIEAIYHPLRKKKRVLALDSVSLKIEREEIFALLGPNGETKCRSNPVGESASLPQ